MPRTDPHVLVGKLAVSLTSAGQAGLIPTCVGRDNVLILRAQILAGLIPTLVREASADVRSGHQTSPHGVGQTSSPAP